MPDLDPLDRQRPYIIEVPGLLSPAECAALIARIDALDPTVALGERAPSVVTAGVKYVARTDLMYRQG